MRPRSRRYNEGFGGGARERGKGLERVYWVRRIACGPPRLSEGAAYTRVYDAETPHNGRDSLPMPRVENRGMKRLRGKYQDSRVEDGVFGAGISHRISLPYRSNSQARSLARRPELKPVTYRTLLISGVEEG